MTTHTVPLDEPPRPVPARRRWSVHVVAGPDEGKEIEIGERLLIIGASRDADLILRDASVSRAHLEMQARGSGVLVRDRGSTNGTFHRGARITEVITDEPAVFRAGRTTLVVDRDAGETGEATLRSARFHGLVGASAPMRTLFAHLRRLAASEAPLLLLGETGTGKELAAAAIHEESRRCSGPMIVVDCTTLQRELAESELFGHVRGSFTGAVADRVGAFQRAAGGTLLVDEIGDLPLDLQPKFLRALETHEVKPLGDGGFRRVDVRIVAATHQDLEAGVREGRFRSDLFYRLAVVTVRMPPLRGRLDDIPLLCEHLAGEMSGRDIVLPVSAIPRLSAYSWPGNVRELRNLVLRWLSSTTGDNMFVPEDLGGEGAGPPPARPAEPVTPAVASAASYEEARRAWTAVFERTYVEDILRAADGNVSEAARRAGIDRNYLHRLMRRHGLKAQRE